MLASRADELSYVLDYVGSTVNSRCKDLNSYYCLTDNAMLLFKSNVFFSYVTKAFCLLSTFAGVSTQKTNNCAPHRK